MFDIVSAIISETFNFPKQEITRDTIAEDVNGWDSLSHTILIIRLEKAVGLQIPEEIAAEATTVGDLSDRIEALARQN